MFPQDHPDKRKSGRVGFWRNIPDCDWNSWQWQMQNRLKSREAIEAFISLSDEEKRGFEHTKNRLAFAVTPHFFNLINPDDPADPLRRQIIPVAEEMLKADNETDDPVGEEKSSPVPGLVHRYPDRVLLLVTDRCASYCRFCTRARLVSGTGTRTLRPQIENALKYIAENKQIRDVLISGGDPLLLADEKIDALLRRLRAIPHVEFIRFGTRVPVFLPQRITPELCDVLKKHGVVWMSVHVNHPNEISRETAEAFERLALAGIVLGSQSVLLRGINDDAGTMRSLVHRLLQVRVRPYYLYACDLIFGSAHWRVPAEKGVEIIRSLRGWTSGYAVPQFVIDAPGGGGKIPLNPNYVESIDENGKITLRNFRGNTFFY